VSGPPSLLWLVADRLVGFRVAQRMTGRSAASGSGADSRARVWRCIQWERSKTIRLVERPQPAIRCHNGVSCVGNLGRDPFTFLMHAKRRSRRAGHRRSTCRSTANQQRSGRVCGRGNSSPCILWLRSAPDGNPYVMLFVWFSGLAFLSTRDQGPHRCCRGLPAGIAAACARMPFSAWEHRLTVGYARVLASMAAPRGRQAWRRFWFRAL